MAKQKSQRRYLSYLLRLWQTSDREEQVWRASLESPGTGERRGFASLKELFDFLKGQTELPSGQDRGLTREDKAHSASRSPDR